MIGSEKSVVYDDLAANPLQMYRQASIHDLEMGIKHEPEFAFSKLEYAEPLVEELRHFLATIKDRSAPRSSGRDGMITVAIIEAIDRSRKDKRERDIFYPLDLHSEIFPIVDIKDCTVPRKQQ
ncbi:hypothetical protein DSM21852_30160 [Methylocystis bryophila]|nr:hypothetical protein DSM21852_30160 [Methylocystis bryophila]